MMRRALVLAALAALLLATLGLGAGTTAQDDNDDAGAFDVVLAQP